MPRSGNAPAPLAPPLVQEWFSTFKPASFRRALVGWYEKHGRSLPWRMTHDPYSIWISEIMLQQTTVVAVIPYYERFLARFPTLDDLARADEQEVLQYWEGLGYYSRARNLHRAARVVRDLPQQRWPEEVERLIELPGIGRYTAGAIASFAFDRRVPIVEANTQRLYARLLGYRDDLKSSAGQAALWSFAEHILPAKSPGRFNQALMELGATVCTPREPDCPTCPVKTCCRAFQSGKQGTIPQPTIRPQITEVTDATVLVQRQDKVFVVRNPPGQRWTGLWDFVRFPVAAGVELPESPRLSRRHETVPSAARQLGLDFDRTVGDSHCAAPAAFGAASALIHEVRERTGLRIAQLQPFVKLKHGVTRFRILLHSFMAESSRGKPTLPDGEWAWVTADELADYPLSKTGRQLADEFRRVRGVDTVTP